MTVATPRKTRTRKTAARKVTTPVKAPKKVTAKVRKVSKPAPLKSVRRPAASKLITPQRYWADIQTRWAIHNYEIQELLKDFSKGFEIVRPYHAQVVKMLAKWALGVNPLFYCQCWCSSGFDSRYRQNQTFAYFQMANADYSAALAEVDFFQDCNNGGEILDTIDAVFETAEDN